jgi:D-lactate dehydrogenase (cytochrome)
MRPETIASLERIVGPAHVSVAAADRALHSADQSAHPARLPEAVVWPATTTEVSAILRHANDHRVPVVGWGAGSSLEGNPIPLSGGIVVDFRRMNSILALHAEDFQVTVQPGLFYKDMNEALARSGLFFAPDPGANASIGGMIANNAAGTRTVRYGATRDNVLALEVVLANGDVMRTGSRSIKQSAGYDLTHLFTGSEGTLGLITEATLKLAPLPEHFSAALASFPSTELAAEAVFGIVGSGLNPAALELLDTATIQAINDAEAVGLTAAPNLLLEFHGASEATLEVEMALVRSICEDSGCQKFEAGIGREARNRLWESRHRLGELLLRSHPGQGYLITDVSVPISCYPALVTSAGQLLADLGNLSGYIFGHAGDGNMHTIVFFSRHDQEALARVQAFNDSVIGQAISLGGTCSGEHGVGIGKQKYLVLEHGQVAVEAMRRLKATFDPNRILNPGKVIP